MKSTHASNMKSIRDEITMLEESVDEHQLLPKTVEPEVEIRQSTSGATQTQLNSVNYLQPESGMTYSEVVAIINEPTEEMANESDGETRTVVYMRASKPPKAAIVAVFKDDRLVSKGQSGLR